MLKSPKIYNRLDQIRKISNAKQVILARKDGLPLQWEGSWYSVLKLINTSYQAALLYKNYTDFFSEDIKYILIDRKKEHSIILPLRVEKDFRINGIYRKAESVKENSLFLVFNSIKNNRRENSLFFIEEVISKNDFDTFNLEDNYPQIIILHRIFKKRKEHLDQLISSKSKDKVQELKIMYSFFQIQYSKYIASELSDIFQRMGIDYIDLRYAFVALDGGFIVDKIVRNEKINNTTLNEISNVIDRILSLTKRSFFYMSKDSFDYMVIECISSCYFIFRLGYGFFFIEIGIPKHLSKSIERKTKYLENYKKNFKFLAKKLEYLIKYTMDNYRFDKDERNRTDR